MRRGEVLCFGQALLLRSGGVVGGCPLDSPGCEILLRSLFAASDSHLVLTNSLFYRAMVINLRVLPNPLSSSAPPAPSRGGASLLPSPAPPCSPPLPLTPLQHSPRSLYARRSPPWARGWAARRPSIPPAGAWLGRPTPQLRRQPSRSRSSGAKRPCSASSCLPAARLPGAPAASIGARCSLQEP